MWLFFIIYMCLMAFVLYCCVRGGSENFFLDEHSVSLKVYYYYNQEENKIIADWSEERLCGCVSLHVYLRQGDPGTGKPQAQFFPQAILRTYKESGEVYDWFEY